MVNHPSQFFIAKRTLGDRSLNPGTIQSLQNLGMRHIYESAKTTYFALPTGFSSKVESFSHLPNEKLQTVTREKDGHIVATLREWFNNDGLCERR